MNKSSSCYAAAKCYQKKRGRVSRRSVVIKIRNLPSEEVGYRWIVLVSGADFPNIYAIANESG
jgi:hypothetical protein